MKVIESTKSYTKRSETLTDRESCYSYYITMRVCQNDAPSLYLNK